MQRIELSNKFLKQKTGSRLAYSKRRNICVGILRKAKLSHTLKI